MAGLRGGWSWTPGQVVTGDCGRPPQPSGHSCSQAAGWSEALWLRCNLSLLFFSSPSHPDLFLIVFYSCLDFTIKPSLFSFFLKMLEFFSFYSL